MHDLETYEIMQMELRI